MTGSPVNDATLQRAARLAATTLRSQASLARRSVELVRATATGKVDGPAAGRAYVQAVAREGARYWRSVAELGLDYASDVVDLGTRVAGTVLDDTTRAGGGGRQRRRPVPDAARAGAGEETTTTAGPRQSVTLRGPLGGRAEGRVIVVNRHPRARRIELSATPLRERSGVPVGMAPELVPVRVTVPAGKEHSISVSVDLDEAVFAAGERYVGELEVTGGDEATLAVVVEVE